MIFHKNDVVRSAVSGIVRVVKGTITSWDDNYNPVEKILFEGDPIPLSADRFEKIGVFVPTRPYVIVGDFVFYPGSTAYGRVEAVTGDWVVLSPRYPGEKPPIVSRNFAKERRVME